MKSTGIIRKIDDLGRIVLPSELRKVLNINIKDGLEIYTEGNTIILKKHSKLKCECGTDINENDIFCRHCGINLGGN